MCRILLPVAIAGCLVLAGCGTDTGDRTASGAGIGATAGAVVGAVTGMSIWQGAVLGAVSGGAVGGLTDEETINLGEPIWADGDTKANEAAVKRVQTGLNQLGYKAGPSDGLMGPKTTAAIRAYQTDHKLLVDGKPTKELARHIEAQLQFAENS